MFRIGFDPILDAEVQHKELIKNIENYRMAKEAMACPEMKTRASFKLLSWIGKALTSVGNNLEQRYGN